MKKGNRPARQAKTLIASPRAATPPEAGVATVGSRVYFAVFGSGIGHVTRALEIAGRLGEGYESAFSSFGQGIGYLQSRGRGRTTLASPSLDIRWEGGGFASWHVLPRFPFTFNAFLRQVAFERRSIEKFDPSVVVSDSRLSPVLAGKAKSYPVVTMLNQFLVSFPPRFRGRVGRVYERIAGDALGLLWSLSDRVLMTDLPPPYTIAESSLLAADVSGVVEFVGFTDPRPRVERASIEKVKDRLGLRRPLVFCQISGPDETKRLFADTILRSAGELVKDHDLVVSMGIPSGSSTPERLASGAWVYEWCPVKDELFELADLVVARAGHSTIGQCINRGKPGVLVPIHNHPEQIGNAEKFSSLGLGRQIRSEKLAPSNFVEAVRDCLGDQSYRSRAEALRAVSERYDGMERTAEVIRSYGRDGEPH